MNQYGMMQNVSPSYMQQGGSMHMGQSQSMMMPHANLLQTVHHCAAICDHMITHLLHHEDVSRRKHQLELLRDCADVCHLTSSFLARNSHIDRAMAQICAHICETCGNECAKYHDQHSQHCARICLQCAQECRQFAMSA